MPRRFIRVDRPRILYGRVSVWATEESGWVGGYRGERVWGVGEGGGNAKHVPAVLTVEYRLCEQWDVVTSVALAGDVHLEQSERTSQTQRPGMCLLLAALG
jgi:hypothetical protein